MKIKERFSATTAPEEEVVLKEDVQEESFEEESVTKTPQPQAIPYPVYLSQDQINNMIIENNLMLKELLANNQ